MLLLTSPCPAILLLSPPTCTSSELVASAQGGQAGVRARVCGYGHAAAGVRALVGGVGDFEVG